MRDLVWPWGRRGRFPRPSVIGISNNPSSGSGSRLVHSMNDEIAAAATQHEAMVRVSTGEGECHAVTPIAISGRLTRSRRTEASFLFFPFGWVLIFSRIC